MNNIETSKEKREEMGCCGNDIKSKEGKHVPHPIYKDICMCCGCRLEQ